MKKLILICACMASGLMAFGQGMNALSKQEKKEGFKLLFDGKTFAGWHTYGKPGQVGASWTIEDGIIGFDLAKKDGGDLITDAAYVNYDFSVDWKISPNGNSGIIFNVTEDPVKYHSTYNTGPEMQVLDDAGHPDGKIIKHNSGDLYDLIKSSVNVTKPVGEWNTARIVNNRGLLQLYLNGSKVVETRTDDANWKAMIAGSKFKTMPGFGVNMQGRIALQDHGNPVWYRNIKIKEL
ncbi:3-keto-disaccharide hydrolase [Aquirufa regiilacus]